MEEEGFLVRICVLKCMIMLVHAIGQNAKRVDLAIKDIKEVFAEKGIVLPLEKVADFKYQLGKRRIVLSLNRDTEVLGLCLGMCHHLL